MKHSRETCSTQGLYSPDHSPLNSSREEEKPSQEEQGASSQPEGTQDQELVVNYDQILTWTPDVVGMWMTDIGLGQYRQLFTERGIQGYLLPLYVASREGCQCPCL